MDRPLEAAHRVAAVQGARKELILRSDEHPRVFGPARPLLVDRTTHELVHAHSYVLLDSKGDETRPEPFDCLGNQAPHRETDDEVQRLILPGH